MDERERIMYERVRKERHPEAYLALKMIRYLKDICKEHMFCDECKFSEEDSCIFTCVEKFEDLDEIEVVERIFK